MIIFALLRIEGPFFINQENNGNFGFVFLASHYLAINPQSLEVRDASGCYINSEL